MGWVGTAWRTSREVLLEKINEATVAIPLHHNISQLEWWVIIVVLAILVLIIKRWYARISNSTVYRKTRENVHCCNEGVSSPPFWVSKESSSWGPNFCKINIHVIPTIRTNTSHGSIHDSVTVGRTWMKRTWQWYLLEREGLLLRPWVLNICYYCIENNLFNGYEYDWVMSMCLFVCLFDCSSADACRSSWGRSSGRY